MAGPVVDVNVTKEALDSRPRPWSLTTPESSVRSYLDWTSYAYRTAQSQVIQYNIQKSRLLDQTLTSITFGKPSIEASRAILPAKEKWTYRYVSIATAGETLGGPYSASYDTTYTVVRSKTGDWVVDSVEARALGKVK
jgi:hypothetical protein